MILWIGTRRHSNGYIQEQPRAHDAGLCRGSPQEIWTRTGTARRIENAGNSSGVCRVFVERTEQRAQHAGCVQETQRHQGGAQETPEGHGRFRCARCPIWRNHRAAHPSNRVAEEERRGPGGTTRCVRSEDERLYESKLPSIRNTSRSRRRNLKCQRISQTHTTNGAIFTHPCSAVSSAAARRHRAESSGSTECRPPTYHPGNFVIAGPPTK